MNRTRKLSRRTSVLRVKGIDHDEEETLEFVETTQPPIPSETNDQFTPVKQSPCELLSTLKQGQGDNITAAEATRLLEVVTKERKLFLRAALQLLDHRENHTADENHNNGHAPGRNTSSTASIRVGLPSRHGRWSIPGDPSSGANAKNKRATRSDIVRYGVLRKATRIGTFSTVAPLWKSKYVELRHGVFSYEDNDGSWNDDVTSEEGGIANSAIKYISLTTDAIICRPFKIRTPHGDCVFELTLVGGPRRLWMASSPQDRDVWVSTIKAVSSGAWGDFLNSPTSDDSKKHPLTNLKSFTALGLGGDEKSRDRSQSTNSMMGGEDGASDKPHEKLVSGCCSFDGSAAPYTEDISRFMGIQAMTRSLSNAKDYRQLLSKLRASGASISIPVSFVKSHAALSNFALAPQDALSRQTLMSVNSSQVWKDLQRDVVRVNGCIITGEEGPEAMIGALFRHISDKAEAIRAVISAKEKLLNRYYDPNDADSVSFDLNEGQILTCARDMLVLCNRTQSGGDTYYCVESMLVDREKGLCILTPYNCEGDPLDITVDIVESRSWQQQQREDLLVKNVTDKTPKHDPALTSKSLLSPRSSELEDTRYQELSSELDDCPTEAPKGMKRPISAPNFTTSSQSIFEEGGASDVVVSQHANAVQSLLDDNSSLQSDSSNSMNSINHGAGSSAFSQSSGKTTALSNTTESLNSPPANTLIFPITSTHISSTSSSSSKKGNQVADIDSLSTISDITDNSFNSTATSQSGASNTSNASREKYRPGSYAQSNLSSKRGVNSSNHTKEKEKIIKASSSSSSSSSSTTTTTTTTTITSNMAHNTGSRSQSPSTLPTHYENPPEVANVNTTPSSSSDTQTLLPANFVTPKRQSGTDGNGSLGVISESDSQMTPRPGDASSQTLEHDILFTSVEDTPKAQPLPISSTLPSSHLPLTYESVNNNNHVSKSTPHVKKGNFFSRAISTPMKAFSSLKSSSSSASSSSSSSDGHSSPGRSLHNKPHEERGMCIRVQVRAVSRYRLCNADPQDEGDDDWALVTGVFEQNFFIKDNCNGRPSLSERLVTIKVQETR